MAGILVPLYEQYMEKKHVKRFESVWFNCLTQIPIWSPVWEGSRVMLVMVVWLASLITAYVIF